MYIQMQNKITPLFSGVILATVFEARMFALVAVFVVIIAILFGNRSQFDFSCHGDIITYFVDLWYN